MAHRLESSFENYDSVAVKGKGEGEVVPAPAMKVCIVVRVWSMTPLILTPDTNWS
jgi:hypothetical protein